VSDHNFLTPRDESLADDLNKALMEARSAVDVQITRQTWV